MSSSSSSSGDRSHHGGAKLVPQPRRQPSTIAPPPAPAKESTNKKPQTAQVRNPDSPTPLPKGQRTVEQSAPQPLPVFYQVPFPMAANMNMVYPGYGRPSYNVPSESSVSSSYLPVHVPSGFRTFISPDDDNIITSSSQSSTTSASNDAVFPVMGLMGGTKLKEHQQQANMYIRYIQQQIFILLQKSYHQEGLAPEFKIGLDQDLKALTQSLGNLQGFVDRIAAEADRAKNNNESQTFQATAGMQAVEIERLRSNLEKLQLQLSQAERSNVDVQGSYQEVLLTAKEQNEQLKMQLEKLRDQLELCQEQLEGKRQLFLSAHDDVEGKVRVLSILSNNDYREKARIIQHLIDTIPQDKAKILEILFSNNAQAPAHNRSVSYQPNMMAIQSGSATPGHDFAWTSRRPSRVTPPAPMMRRTPSAYQPGSVMRPQSAMPHSNRFSQPRSRPSTGGPGSSRVDGGGASYRFGDNDLPASAQESGSPQLSRNRQLVLAQGEAELTLQVEQWKEEFSSIFRSVRGWTRKYACQVQEDQAKALEKGAPRLFDFMCDILYPGQPEAAAAHAHQLLKEPESRPYLVERLMLQYVVNNIFSVEGFKKFDEETDRELNDLSHRLYSTEVFKTYLRQTLIDKISGVIGRILADPDFHVYRVQRINHHQERLKIIVGPLMDASASRADASYDLHMIATNAMQTSAQIHQSRLAFDFGWGQLCTKFSVDFHNVREAPLDPLMVQAKQWRLKLVITPAILFRDDRDPAVTGNPKRVLRAEVLVMP